MCTVQIVSLPTTFGPRDCYITKYIVLSITCLINQKGLKNNYLKEKTNKLSGNSQLKSRRSEGTIKPVERQGF